MKRNNGRASVRFFPLTEWGKINAVSGVNVTNRFTRHVHGTFTLGLMSRGEREIVREKETVIIPRNSIFIINPGDWHVCASHGDGGCDYSVLSIPGGFMKRISSQISEKASPGPFFPKTRISDPKMAVKMGRLFSILGKEDSRLERESLLISILSRLVLRHGEDPPVKCRVGRQREAVERAQNYLRAHYKENISLGGLSEVACLSPYHFQRVFVKETGVSPHDYLMQLKVKKARALLGDESILDVALELGFTDQSHFSRFFKRHTGVPPGRYVSINL